MGPSALSRRVRAPHRYELARWWGDTPAEAGRVLRGIGEAVRTVRLLPAFDQYVVTATRQAHHFLPGPHADRIYRAQGWLSPVLLVDGMMAGIWRVKR